MISLNAIKETYSIEAAFIVLVLRVRFHTASQEDISNFIKSNNINWNLVADMAESHEIRPTIYKTLVQNEDLIDAGFLLKLKRETTQVAARNLQNLQEILRLNNIFSTLKLKAVPYKGVILSYNLYNNYSLRESCDIDFLIDPRDAKKIDKALLSAGYTTDYHFGLHNESRVMRFTCQKLYYKTGLFGDDINVEIQWKVLPDILSVPVENKRFLEKTGYFTVENQTIPVLNSSHTLLTIILHHGVSDGWRTLKHLVDLTSFLEKKSDEVDWTIFKMYIYNHKIVKFYTTGIALADLLIGKRFFKPEIPQINERVLRNLLNYPLISSSKFTLQQFLQHISLRERFLDKAKFVAKAALTLFFYPNENDFRSIYFPQTVFFLYFIFKPFRLIVDGISRRLKEAGSEKISNKL